MKNDIKKIINSMHKAIKEYNMISAGDKIAVGVSGGKDSLTLLKGLAFYRKGRQNSFSITAIFVDIFGNSNTADLEAFCRELEVEFVYVKSNIKEVVFDIRKEKNPCSLCAFLRRGQLNSKAVELGCNKVALGHHADDFIQTFWLSFTQENRFSSFWPVTYLSKMNLYVIRPMLYVWENTIESHKDNLPIIVSNCPANKKTEREAVKIMLAEMDKKTPNFKKNLHGSLCHYERYNLFDKSLPLLQNNKE